MKKMFLFVVFGLMMTSCKKTDTAKGVESVSTAKEVESVDNKVVLGEDRDERGCVGSAGYKWSVLMNKCILVFEEGYRLNPENVTDTEDETQSAFVVFEEDGNRAELFVPGEKESIILERESEGKPYVKDDWSLFSWKGYVIKKGDVIKYTGV